MKPAERLKPELLVGVNYPWTAFEGRSNYGCDFGANVWGGHSGVTAHLEEVESDFATMAAMGFTIVRWFVLTDGRGGIRWDRHDLPLGVADRFFEDFDAALDIAGRHAIRLCLVLFDYLWMRRGSLDGTAYAPNPELLASPEGRARLFETVIDPVLGRYGTTAVRNGIHSIDIINEPDWVTEGLEYRGNDDDDSRPFSLTELSALVSETGDRVRRAWNVPVTVGGARVRHVREWDEPAHRLDFIQVHSYPDVRHPERDRSLIGLPCRALGVSKPVLIGEFPGNGDRLHPDGHHPPPFSAQDYERLALEGGYLGAWPWSFKGHDAFGGLTGLLKKENT